MSNRVRKAITAVCVFKRSDGTMGTGIVAISATNQLLSAEASVSNPTVLINAAKIVHEYMYFITDEAMRIALLIAGDESRPSDPVIEEKAASYLFQGVTISEVRKFYKGEKIRSKNMNEVLKGLRTHGLIKDTVVTPSEVSHLPNMYPVKMLPGKVFTEAAALSL